MFTMVFVLFSDVLFYSTTSFSIQDPWPRSMALNLVITKRKIYTGMMVEFQTHYYKFKVCTNWSSCPETDDNQTKI